MSTYWRRVRYDSDNPPWELLYDEERGHYAIATRDISAGEHICTEFPVLWIEGHHPFNEEQIDILISKVNDLCEEDKEAYYAMANVYSSEEFHPAVGIFMTNCFDMTDSIYGTCSAMYLALARLNHSCVPNVQQTHLPETTEEVLYASRSIKKGEEINDCYIDLRQTYSSRQKDLREHYRFTCMCAGCYLATDPDRIGGNSEIDGDNTDNSSSHRNTEDNREKLRAQRQLDDKTRVLAANILDILTSLIEEDYIEEAYRQAIASYSTLSSQLHTRWSVRYLSEICLCIYNLAESLGDKSSQRKYLNDAHRWNVLLTGPRSEETKKTSLLLESL